MGEFVASSAPRHQGNGSVLIFDSLSREGAAQRHFMIGLQYGEYFGATLCSEDFNSDGYTDLVVGAPLHSSRYSDEGRAYIYMGGQKMSASPDSILHGGKSRFGRFGKSISAVGDLNADGYPDLAVSAPLENNGVVYIYHGSRAGVITVDVQRLEPQLLKPQPLVPPMNFGETVEGKVDVDGNGYPDLIIGAPVTSSIIIMLTRPVVNVNLTIISSDEIDSRSKACMETGPSSAFNSCFNCSVCFLFHGRSLPTEILLQYNIYADVLQEKSRVSFTSTGQDHVTGSVKLFSQEKFYCHDYSLRMKPKVRDFMNPVALGLHYHLDDRFMPEPVRNVTTTTTTTPTLENSTLSSSGDYEYEGEEESKRKKRNVGDEKELFPILNMYNHKYYQTGVPFKTFCRNITQCIADVKLITQTINKIGEAISSITVGRDRIIRIRVKVTNIGPEDAHDTRVTVIYSNKLYFNVLKKTDDTIDACFENDGTPEIYDDSRKIFSFKLRSYILMKGDFCVVDILFGITYLLDPYTDGSAEFNISTSTLSLDENTTNSNQKVKVDLTYTAPLTFTGVSWPNVATVQTNSSYFPLGLNELQNTSQLVEQVFLISNLGNMELRNMVLNVEWPANVFMDNQLYDGFYIKNITCTGRMARCSCSSENLIDKYEIFSNISSQPSLKIPDSPINLQSFIDCQGACVTNFQCTVDYIRGYGSIQLTVVALPYPNTFSTLQSSILVKSTGSLQIKEKGFLIFDFRKGGKTTNIETKVIPLKQFEFAGQESGFVFPLWAYILSAVIGLLLLLLLMFILKMCGFFKSKYGEKKKAAEEERQWGEAAVPLKQ